MNARLQPANEAALEWGELQPAELDELLAIEQQVFSHPWTRGNFLDSLAAGHLAWTLRERLHGELLGYLVAMRVLDECHLLTIAVARRHWGRGLARQMLQRLIEQQRAAGMRQIWLEVRASNQRAQQLYLQLGFRQVGLRKAYYPAALPQREDALLLSLDLRAEGG